MQLKIISFSLDHPLEMKEYDELRTNLINSLLNIYRIKIKDLPPTLVTIMGNDNLLFTEVKGDYNAPCS